MVEIGQRADALLPPQGYAPTMTVVFTVNDVCELYPLFKAPGFLVWLMGGWGVDALRGRQSRPHKDLDLLVLLPELAAFDQLTRDLGFERKYVWNDENRWVDLAGQPYPTAYVIGDTRGARVGHSRG